MYNAIRTLKAELADATTASDRIRLLSALLREFLFTSQTTGACQFARELLDLSQRHHDKKNESVALIFLGNCEQNNGLYESALHFYSKALLIARQHNDPHDILHALNNIGSIYFMLDRYDKVLKYSFDILSQAGTAGVPIMAARACNNIGAAYMTMEDYEQAKLFYSKAVSIGEQLDDVWFQCHLLNNLGNVSLLTDGPDAALELFDRALALAQEHDYTSVVLKSLTYQAEAYTSLGSYDRARRAVQKALAIARTLDQAPELHRALQSCGLLEEKIGRLPQALACFSNALSVARSATLLLAELETEESLVRVCSAMQDYCSALAHQENVIRIDSIRFDREKSRIAEELRVQYEIQKQERETNRYRSRIRELRSACDSAASASKAKNQFLATISHELRSPMNGVLLSSELLAKTSLSSEQHQYVDMISSSAEALLASIDAIIDIARIEADTFHCQLQPFSLRFMLDAVLAEHADAARNKNIRLYLAFNPVLPSLVIGDQSLCRRVISSLVINAIQYSPDGQVTVRAEPADAPPHNACIAISVSDTGPGIEPDVQKYIFDIFAMVPPVSDAPVLGLGLTVAAKLVQAMQGTISVSSTPGQGSSFRVSIPLPAAQSSVSSVADLTRQASSRPNISAAPAPAAISSNSSLQHILLVDDKETNRKITSLLLGKLGYSVAVVSNGQEAIDYLKYHACDLVFMDCKMPVMDGFMSARIIRNLDSDMKHIPIIAMSAYAAPADREKCLAAGMNDHISKPIRIKNVQSLLTRWLP